MQGGNFHHVFRPS